MNNVYEESTYWEDAHYVTWEPDGLRNCKLSDKDLEVLCAIGIPSWVAPNMHFDNFEMQGDILKLGEDRDDRDIYVNKSTGVVCVGRDEQFMNTSVFSLRRTLQQYAIMVEKAVNLDRQSVRENRISSDLIIAFKEALKRLDSFALVDGLFWSKEIERISR
jgi:hypothetical protein